MRLLPRSRLFLLFLLPLAACGKDAPASRGAATASPPVTNRIPLPPEVVANLGVTFEKARLGRLETRLRVPGRVEIAPEARFTVRAPAAGRVVLRVVRWQRVAAGEVLGELLSPELRASQESLAEAHAGIERADVDILRARAESGPLREIAEATEAALAAARERAIAAEGALVAARALEASALARVTATAKLSADSSLPASTLFAAQKDHVEAQAAALEAAGRRDDAKALVPDLVMKLSVAQSRAATTEREIAILERKKATSEVSYRQQLRALAVLTGLSVEELEADGPQGHGWLRLESIPLRAPAAGLVVEVTATAGEWLEGASTVLRVADPSKVVFRGEVPEADTARIPIGADVRIEVGCADCGYVEAKLTTPLTIADPRTRTVGLEIALPGDGAEFPDGVSATAAVLLERSKNEEVLVPTACVVQDELETIVFRRDPAKADQLIRQPVAVGRRSEGLVEVLSELSAGDEVVRDGIHQLRLTGTGKAPANGHFHSDGTFHEGKD